MKKLIAILTLSILTTTTAHAGILIDPYLNYITTGSADYAPGASMTGNELGVRLGWNSFIGLGFGVDYILSGKYTYSASGVSSDSTPSGYGVFASYKFPILVRGYISYFLYAKDKTDSGTYATGTGTKIGVQYTGLPFIAIGLETYAGNYNKLNSGAGDVSVSDKSSH
ncbi:MAG: hypothetical protein ACXVAX_07060, partial [Pseudobdellovibrio sp.]